MEEIQQYLGARKCFAIKKAGKGGWEPRLRNQAAVDKAGDSKVLGKSTPESCFSHSVSCGLPVALILGCFPQQQSKEKHRLTQRRS